jgi:peptidoglycan/xylan/chitin deacetylase (PgdA/CDA1 family)
METIKKILKTQNPANHTVHHSHMGGMTTFDPMDLSSASCGIAPTTMPFDCEKEMTGVEEIISDLSGGARPHLTRFRTPYGEPFVPVPGLPALPSIKTLTKKYAVHVGWNIDSKDSFCEDAACAQTQAATEAKLVEDFFGTAPGQGQGWGIILMHGSYRWSFEASKRLLDPATGTLIKRGFKMGTVEDAICWKYGKHSWDLVNSQGGVGRAAN